MFHIQRSFAAAIAMLAFLAAANCNSAIAQEAWQPFGSTLDAPPRRSDSGRDKTANTKPYLAPVPMPDGATPAAANAAGALERGG